MGTRQSRHLARLVARGEVVDCSGRSGQVEVLVEYGVHRERRLCAFPVRLWRREMGPSLGQACELEFVGTAKYPKIRILKGGTASPAVASPSREAARRDAQRLLGISPDDKVTIVVSGNYFPPRSAEFDPHVSLGWGEGLGLKLLFRFLDELGVRTKNIETVFPWQICDTDPAQVTPDNVRASDLHFDTQTLAESSHVIFLGSILSNSILWLLFWKKMLSVSSRFAFRHPGKDPGPIRYPLVGGGRPELVMFSDDAREAKVWKLKSRSSTADAVDNGEDDETTEDPFLLAVTANPYDNTGYHRCILSCGAGTFGTGYGVVALTARSSSRRIATDVLSGGKRRPEWAVVCEARGRFFDPKNDPVWCLHGLSGAPFVLLPNAISAPPMWAEDSEDTQCCDSASQLAEAIELSRRGE